MQNSMKNRATSTMRVRLVHDDHAAGTHDGAELAERFVIDGRVQRLGGDAAAGRSAGLDGLDFAAVGSAAAHGLDDVAQGGAHGHLDQAGIGNLARQGEDLGALALLGADAGEPIRAFADDGRRRWRRSRRC